MNRADQFNPPYAAMQGKTRPKAGEIGAWAGERGEWRPTIFVMSPVIKEFYHGRTVQDIGVRRVAAQG